jgi:hypothetical protein
MSCDIVGSLFATGFLPFDAVAEISTVGIDVEGGKGSFVVVVVEQAKPRISKRRNAIEILIMRVNFCHPTILFIMS